MTESKDFEELRLLPGQKMQVSIDSYTEVRDDCSYIGMRASKSILVTTPVVNGAPLSIKVGTGAAVRFFANNVNSVCAFHSHVIHVTQAIFPHLHLALPTDLQLGEVRKAVRAKVNLPCTGVSDKSDKHEPGLIDDLSVNGARYRCKGLRAESGDTIRLVTRLEILGMKRIVELDAIVRSVNRVKQIYAYGLQFTDLKNDDKIALHAFVMSNL